MLFWTASACLANMVLFGSMLILTGNERSLFGMSTLTGGLIVSLVATSQPGMVDSLRTITTENGLMTLTRLASYIVVIAALLFAFLNFLPDESKLCLLETRTPMGITMASLSALTWAIWYLQSRADRS